jgi:hypothetical protein
MKVIIMLYGLLLIGIIFLGGCTPYISVLAKCQGCDNNISNDECNPICLDIERNPNARPNPISPNMELVLAEKSYGSRKIFSLNGSSYTEETISCTCYFQELSPSEHKEALKRFGKTENASGSAQ